MKRTIFSLLLLTAIGFVACKKDKYQPDIKQFDDDQIKAYISSSGLSGFAKEDSGMYYKIISPGTGPALQYTDSIAFVFTLRSFDGNYISTDTINNHYEDFMGHIKDLGYPIGLQLAMHNLLNHRGGTMRLLVPSHLGYGAGGTGSGSSTVSNTRIKGNQGLDYYIHVISDQYDVNHSAQDAYDQQIIKNYIAANNLTSTMHLDPSGFWYAITTPGTGTVPITDDSSIAATFTLQQLNNQIIDQYNVVGGTSIDMPDFIKGMQIGLKKYATAGAKITFLIPSSLGAGKQADGTAPPNSCLRYDIQILEVSP